MKGFMLKKLIKFYKERYNKIKDKLDFTYIDKTQVNDPFLNIKKDKIILIIGEAPGRTEVELKKPFCGLSGKNLLYLINQSGLNRESDFIITNAFPFRTFESISKGVKNRTPNKKELEIGSELLIEELKIIKPDIILLLGGSALKSIKYIPEINENVKDLKRNEFKNINIFGFNTIITRAYHPSPLVYNTKSKADDLILYFGKLSNVFYN